jgi:kynurenine formamidase
MADRAPAEADVVALLETLAIPVEGIGGTPGSLRWITPETRLAAIAEARDGTTVGCGREIVIEADASDVPRPPGHEVIETQPHTEAAPRVTTQSDTIMLPSHGVTVTHLDALAHFAVDGRIHGGHAARAATAADPPAPGRVHELRDGIVARGVLLDVARMFGRPWLEAGEGIGPAELEAAEAEAGVRVGRADALLIRTGWPLRRAEAGPVKPWKHRPGLHASALPWLRDRQVGLVASDAAHDVVPSGYERIPMPIHTVGLVALGLCLIDACDFEALAEACRSRGRATCLFVVAPLVFRNATGSPVNPVAIL